MIRCIIQGFMKIILLYIINFSVIKNVTDETINQSPIYLFLHRIRPRFHDLFWVSLRLQIETKLCLSLTEVRKNGSPINAPTILCDIGAESCLNGDGWIRISIQGEYSIGKSQQVIHFGDLRANIGDSLTFWVWILGSRDLVV